MGKRYGISEWRRCPGCHTKSYTKLLASFKIYSYHCKKCGHVHSVFDIASSLELVNLIRYPHNLPILTIANVIRILETPPTEPWTVREFDSDLEKLYESEYPRPRSLRDLMNIVLSEISLVGVEVNPLLKTLKSKHDIDGEMVLRLIKQLIKENLVYEPKKGCFKRKS